MSESLLRRLSGWTLRHRRLVVIAWIVLAVAGFASGGALSNALSTEFAVPGRESHDANREIRRVFGVEGSVAPIVIVAGVPAGQRIDREPAQSQFAAAVESAAARLPHARVASPSSAAARPGAFVSSDHRTAYALVYPATTGGGFEAGLEDVKTVRAALADRRVAGAPVHVTGSLALNNAKSGRGGIGVLGEALVGGAGALLVLAFVFASALAFVPLLMAIVAIPTTFLLVLGVAQVAQVSFIVQFLIVLIGLGVAIDYALLIVMRWREEREGGIDNEQAVVRAVENAGRAVVVSGSTVAIGLLALVAIPVPFVRSLGYGGMLIPLVSVAVALTLLPVLLASLGPRLDRRRLRRSENAERHWRRFAAAVVRRRWLATAAGLAVMLPLASAAFSINVAFPNPDSLAKSGDAVLGLKQLEAGGIGSGPFMPFDVLVEGGDVPKTAAALRRVAGVREVAAPGVGAWRRQGAELVSVVPEPNGTSPAGRAVLKRLLAVADRQPGSVLVGGVAAQDADFVSAVYGSFTLLVGLVAFFTFLLLTRAFRSLVLPLKALALNALSVAAAWGILVLVWQQGHGSRLLWDIPATGSITEFIPAMVFAYLFGLSMDYEVFVLARIREEYDQHGDTDRAIVGGIGRTGRLVTSAALILFLAFAALAAAPNTNLKIFATGLGAGILLDALVVRALLLPALVSLFGRANWWLPGPLARLLGRPALAEEAP
jgi:putative drug exporter of the RND superfamily